MALRESDPEMFQFIAAMSARRSAQIEGGFSWEVRDARLACDESLDSGFDECEVDVSVSVTNHAQSPDQRNADVDLECEAELVTVLAGGFMLSQREQESDSGGLSSGGTQTIEVSMNFDLYSPSDPVVHAKVGDVSCEITNIR